MKRQSGSTSEFKATDSSHFKIKHRHAYSTSVVLKRIPRFIGFSPILGINFEFFKHITAFI